MILIGKVEAVVGIAPRHLVEEPQAARLVFDRTAGVVVYDIKQHRKPIQVTDIDQHF